MSNNYLARKNQALACRFAVYRVDAQGNKVGMPITRHISEESANKNCHPMLDGSKCAVFPYNP